MRQGREYLAALQDGRTVYLGGEPVADLTQHAAFAGAAQPVAGLYELACDPANAMCYQPPDCDAKANTVFMIPRSREDLAARRLASTRWAQATCGFFGRGPMKTCMSPT